MHGNIRIIYLRALLYIYCQKITFDNLVHLISDTFTQGLVLEVSFGDFTEVRANMSIRKVGTRKNV